MIPLDDPAYLLKRKKGRFYWLLQSGLTYHAGEVVRFVTLTSSDESPEMREMPYSLKKLILDIRRLTPNKLVKSGYLRDSQLKNYYPRRDRDAGLCFECAYCRTSEGNGVIHAASVGDYIPQPWLSDTWMEKHRAWNVNISLVEKDNLIKKYMMRQYLAGQESFIRGGSTHQWLFPHAREQWLTLLKVFKTYPHDDAGYQVALHHWNSILNGTVSFREVFPDGIPSLPNPYQRHGPQKRGRARRKIRDAVNERLGYNRSEVDLDEYVSDIA